MSYNPVLPSGQGTAATSSPVVLASDVSVPTDLAAGNQIDELVTAVRAIAGAKGVLADIRVTPSGTGGVMTVNIQAASTLATVTTVTTVSAVNNLNNLGAGASGTSLHSAATVVPSLANIAYNGSFSANITRP